MKAATRLGVDLAALNVPGFSQASPQVPVTPAAASASPLPVQPMMRHEAHILPANARRLLSQPETRQEIRRMIREVDEPGSTLAM